MTFCPQLDAPVPVSANWESLFQQIRVVFSVPLVDMGLFTHNWTARINGHVRDIITAVVTGSTVLLGSTQGVADPGPDVVSFDPPPFDLVSEGGLVPAPAFTDYPVVV